ncbi:hypothetical protein AVEN_222129-1 [Araneus ventricosus]|uniref:Uncharacterized protein n=1 Tax=Araneus ventricosus TaxID=182803 RepID=A0A4Y2DXR4_ARAVE|nr:hypothetical protein AVEN_222129-1 [Araneus ventricosus]
MFSIIARIPNNLSTSYFHENNDFCGIGRGVLSHSSLNSFPKKANKGFVGRRLDNAFFKSLKSQRFMGVQIAMCSCLLYLGAVLLIDGIVGKEMVFHI